MLEGCPSLFWLGNFQFLTAFLSLVLRQAALIEKVPLHVMRWKFRFTPHPSPDPSSLVKDKQESNLKQSRDETISLDDLENSLLLTESNENVESSNWKQLAISGLQVYGLWLVGATWDTKRYLHRRCLFQSWFEKKQSLYYK